MKLNQINICELNQNARTIFENSDQEALKDFFGNCQTVEEINKTANDLYILWED